MFTWRLNVVVSILHRKYALYDVCYKVIKKLCFNADLWNTDYRK